MYIYSIPNVMLRNRIIAQVRALAAAAGLPNSARKDSQGICFLGKVKVGLFSSSFFNWWDFYVRRMGVRAKM